MTTAPAPISSLTPHGMPDHGMPDLSGRPIPFTRLTRVELRKMVDTRAGIALMVIVTAASLAVIGGTLVWGGEQHSLAGFLNAAVLPLSLLLPIVGIMGATAEWSQRTGLVTFALEPRRGRVVAAKVIASVLLGLVVLAVVGLAASATVLGSGGSWNLTGPAAGGLVLGLILLVLQGVGFGFSLLNTPAAIVATFLLPTVWMIAGGLVSGVETAAQWLDLNTTVSPLMSGEMTGTAWAQLATSAAVWIGVPMAIGTWRVLTREVK